MSGSNSSNGAMNMFSNNSQNTSSGSNNFGQNVFDPQGTALGGAYGQAGNLYGTTSGQTQGQIPGAIDYSNQQAQGAGAANLNNMQGGAYGGLNIGKELMGSLNQSQNSPSNTQAIYSQMMGGGNSYLQPLQESMLQNEANAQNLNSGQNAAQAAASGMSGGSRQGVQDALMKSMGNQNLTEQMNKMGYNTYDKALQDRLGIAQQADANTLGRQQMMSGMLGQQQGTSDRAVANTGNVQGLGQGGINAINSAWGGLNNYRNSLGDPTVLNSGSSQRESQGTSNGWGMGNSSGSSKGSGLL